MILFNGMRFIILSKNTRNKKKSFKVYAAPRYMRDRIVLEYAGTVREFYKAVENVEEKNWSKVCTLLSSSATVS